MNITDLFINILNIFVDSKPRRSTTLELSNKKKLDTWIAWLILEWNVVNKLIKGLWWSQYCWSTPSYYFIYAKIINYFSSMLNKTTSCAKLTNNRNQQKQNSTTKTIFLYDLSLTNYAYHFVKLILHWNVKKDRRSTE